MSAANIAEKALCRRVDPPDDSRRVEHVAGDRNAGQGLFDVAADCEATPRCRHSHSVADRQRPVTCGRTREGRRRRRLPFSAWMSASDGSGPAPAEPAAARQQPHPLDPRGRTARRSPDASPACGGRRALGADDVARFPSRYCPRSALRPRRSACRADCRAVDPVVAVTLPGCCTPLTACLPSRTVDGNRSSAPAVTRGQRPSDRQTDVAGAGRPVARWRRGRP